MRNLKIPTFVFEGPDGTGKTTQALLACAFFEKEMQIKTAYCSFPVYETPIGRVIGRCLGRWPDQKLEIPSAKDFAVLYALNRLETLSGLTELMDRNYLLVLNRGPFANAYNVARLCLEERLIWEKLSKAEKQGRVLDFMIDDSKFFKEIWGRGEMINVFMFMDTATSMRLAEERAKRTLSQADANERYRALQKLTVAIYQNIADGEAFSFTEGKVSSIAVQARVGSMRRFMDGGQEDMDEFNGIYDTAIALGKEMDRHFKGFGDSLAVLRDQYLGREWKPGIFYTKGIDHARDVYTQYCGGAESQLPFEFRNISHNLGLEVNYDIGYFGHRLLEERPGAMSVIEASFEIDRAIEGVKHGAERK